jgi:hypothetical protein
VRDLEARLADAEQRAERYREALKRLLVHMDLAG